MFISIVGASFEDKSVRFSDNNISIHMNPPGSGLIDKIPITHTAMVIWALLIGTVTIKNFT